MKTLLIAPLVIPLAAAIVSLLLLHRLRVQRWLAVLGSAMLLCTAVVLLVAVWNQGIQATHIGSWPFPYGISLAADLFSAIMVLLAGIIGFVVVIYSYFSIDTPREMFGYYPVLHFLLLGVCGAFLTADLFNLYVWFEVMLMASFVLMSLGGERAQLEGAFKYVMLNLLSSAFFLAGVGLLYGVAGSLNLADLAERLSGANAESGLVTTVSLLFLVAFGIKAAVFPLFFWLPASYHTPPVAVSAVFAGLLTKVGVYAMIRVFTLLFISNPGFTHTLILVLAGLTMITGVLGAAAQNEFRRILSFHIISQIGYMIMGLGLAGLALNTPELAVVALAGSIFYIIHHIIVKTNLFLISGISHRLLGSFELKELGGLYRSYPAVAILFLIPALSLAGVPPLSGFFAKLTLVRAGLELEYYLIVATALVVGLLTLFSMTKIWAEAFWKPPPPNTILSGAQNVAPTAARRRNLDLLLPVGVLAIITVAIGLAAEPVFVLSKHAAEQLLNRTEYIDAVRRGQP